MPRPAGRCPHTDRVGQAGRSVSPQPYIADGVPGAIRHRAGAQTPKTIAAVEDAKALIFDLVGHGVAGGLFGVVPQLTEEINARKG